VEGHSGARGTREYNLALGQRRGERGARLLVAAACRGSGSDDLLRQDRPAQTGSTRRPGPRTVAPSRPWLTRMRRGMLAGAAVGHFALRLPGRRSPPPSGAAARALGPSRGKASSCRTRSSAAAGARPDAPRRPGPVQPQLTPPGVGRASRRVARSSASSWRACRRWRGTESSARLRPAAEFENRRLREAIEKLQGDMDYGSLNWKDAAAFPRPGGDPRGPGARGWARDWHRAAGPPAGSLTRRARPPAGTPPTPAAAGGARRNAPSRRPGRARAPRLRRGRRAAAREVWGVAARGPRARLDVGIPPSAMRCRGGATSSRRHSL
jgi:hypothetical protein